MQNTASLLTAPFPRSVAARHAALGLALLLAGATAHAQTPTGSGNTPLSLTGWNANIINSAGGPAVTAFDKLNSYGWYANGYSFGGTTGTNGLPTSGYATFDGNQYQIPSYTGNDVVLVSTGDTAKTLTLTTPTQYQSLSFLATNANSGSTATTESIQINFTDSSTSNYTLAAPDWYQTGTGSLTNMQRTSTNGPFDLTPFGITETELALTTFDQAKTISSITFNAPTQAGYNNAVFAVSGFTGSTTSGTTTAINDPTGSFTGTDFVANGSSYFKQNTNLTPVLRLTDGNNGEAGSAYATNKVNVRNAFTVNFNFQLSQGGTGQPADGFTFLLQGNNPYSVGAGGGALGYMGISNSAGIAFDVYNQGATVSRTGFISGGAQPANYSSTGSLNMYGTGIVQAQIVYDGTNLIETLTQGATTYQTTYSGVNLAALIGGDNAYIGFTGGTGGLNMVQDISSFSFMTGIAGVPEPSALALLPLGLGGLGWAARRRGVSQAL